MRISTYNAYESTVSNLQRRQTELARAQEQLTSGKRVAKASDDPAAAARAERALTAVARSEADQRALEASRSAMQLTESALGDAGELMQRAREIVVSAGNASYTDAERAMLVQSLQGIREQLLAVANRADGVGSHLFSGQGSSSPPFVEVPVDPLVDPTVPWGRRVEYQGAAGDATVTSSEALPIAIDGNAAWLQAPDPSGGTLSAFETLDRMIYELGTAGRTNAQITTTVQTGVADIDAVAGHMLGVRARSGEMLNRTDSVETHIADAKLGAQYERSLAEDLDMVQAVSDFQNQQTGYDAALKTYSMVRRMSLFEYIG